MTSESKGHFGSVRPIPILLPTFNTNIRVLYGGGGGSPSTMFCAQLKSMKSMKISCYPHLVVKSKFAIQILDTSYAYDCDFLRALTLSFLVFPFGTLMGKPLNLQIKHNIYKKKFISNLLS